MVTMNISLSEALKNFVDEQVSQGGYVSSSEYVRDLLRREQGRLQLRSMLLEGINSDPAGVADDAYFDDLKRKIRDAARKRCEATVE